MESAIKAFTTCSICLDSFGPDERCPLVLYCGHTFCHECIQNLIDEDRRVCPTCRSYFEDDSAYEIPINFRVKSFSETFNQTKTNGLKLTNKDLEEKTIYVVKREVGGTKYSKVTLIDDQISFEDWEDGMEEGASCVDLLDFINCRTVVIDTHKFIEENKEALHNPELPKDRIKYSQIKVKGREVSLNAFEPSERSDYGLEFEKLMKILGCTSALPVEAFLKIENLSGEIVIATDGGSPRALNFILLASGIMDESYQGTDISGFGVESVVDGGYKRCSMLPCVVQGIEDGGIYNRESPRRGDVRGISVNRPNQLSHFCVWKNHSYSPSTTTFGRVKRGMKVVDQIQFFNSVKNCGLVLDLQ